MGKAIVGLVLLLGLTSCAPANPAQPAPVTPTAAVPASITLTSVSGSGASAGTIDVDATVHDVTGRGVPGAVVLFTTSAGSMAFASITADGGGLAQATLTTSMPATVTATSGPIAANLVVTPLAPPAVFVQQPFVPTPIPTPIAQPVIIPPAPTLTASVLCTAEPAGSQTVCNAAAAYGGAAINSSLITQIFWDFGDGLTGMVAQSPLAAHAYAQVGTYLVRILVTATPPNVGVLAPVSASTSVVIPAPAATAVPKYTAKSALM